MSQTRALTIQEALLRRDEFIWVDVRSESEFERAHIPNAINVPILCDEDRAAVGRAYKHEGREAAVMLGLSLTGPKFASIYQQLMEIQHNNQKKLLFYCWRGGLRSQIASTITQWSGHPVFIVKDGYKSYRNWVLQTLQTPLNIVLIAGHTGSGKTELLQLLQNNGKAIIDLEKRANHKGSALGGVGMPAQPRNEMFENLIAIDYLQFHNKQTVYIENESRTVGQCAVPEGLWKQMQEAPSLEIHVDAQTRINRIIKEYAGLPKDQLIAQTQKLRKRLGGQHEQAAVEALEANDFKTWVEILLVYYDKSYQHFVDKNNTKITSIAWDWNQIESSLLTLINTQKNES
ncbi:MAG: tRNA 2-selenouridine(34) synthase MnmH [Bacteroidetes bacterium]|nr:tRNA 2-selenouridine(34) synthase MnmH [Bacteroidota bacterium]